MFKLLRYNMEYCKNTFQKIRDKQSENKVTHTGWFNLCIIINLSRFLCVSLSKKSVLFDLLLYSKMVLFVKSSNTKPAIWFTLQRVFKKIVVFFLLSKYIKVNILHEFLWKTKGKWFYKHLMDNNQTAVCNGHRVVSICVTWYFYLLLIEYTM